MHKNHKFDETHSSSHNKPDVVAVEEDEQLETALDLESVKDKVKVRSICIMHTPSP